MSLSHHPNIVRNGLVAYFDAANPKSYPAGQDPYVNNVSLMLSMDGANNSTTFIDSSQNALAVTAVADAKISTAQSKFGGSAAYFDGTGDYLTVASNAAIAFGLGDFTIECWINFSALPGNNIVMCIANTMTSLSSATFTMWWFGLYNNAGTNRLQLGRHGNGDVFAYVNWTPSLNTWYHIAVTRSSSSVIKLFIDGVSQSVTTSGSNWANDFSATGILSIGEGATFLEFNGYMDEFRLTKGIARYTASFTPPAAPLSLPGRITNLTTNKGVGSFIGSGISYSSTNAGIVTLDGSNGYGVLPNTLTIGPTSTFTLCAWVNYISRPTGGVARRSVLDQSVNTNDFEPILGFPYTYSASKMGLEVGKAGVASQIAYSANTNNLDQWYYLTGLFKNGSADFYINGVYQSSVTYSATVNSATANSKNWGIGGVFFNGTIVGPYANCKVGPVQVYNRNLASGEIFQNYNATKSRYGY